MKKQYDFSKGKRRPVVPLLSGKTRITIRIDDDLIEWFKKQVLDGGGGSYQALMNRALRDFVDRETEPLEETLRRVLHEILPASGPKRRTATKKRPATRKAPVTKKATSKKIGPKKSGRKKSARK
jgi:hypothetical protein